MKKALEEAQQKGSEKSKKLMQEAEALVRKGDIKSLKELDEKLNNFLTEKTAYKVGMSDAEMKFWAVAYASSQATREVFLPTNILDFTGGKLAKKGVKAVGILYDLNKAAAKEHRIAKTLVNNIAGVKPPLKLHSNSNIKNIIPLNKNYKHITYQGKETISDGKYIVDPIGMARHKPGTVESKNFINKSLFKSDVDAERAALDAARYADKHNLWRQNKAKVPTLDIVGYSQGKPTKVINVYRKDNGVIHATPGN